MQAELRWGRRADNHLQAIFDFLVGENPRAVAESYIEDIMSACDRLRSFPRAGRQYDSRYRVIVVKNHLIFYRYDAEARWSASLR